MIEAIRTKGFFYVINYGISQEAVNAQFALGQKFYELPLDEKLKYEPDLDSGDYNGYRPAGRRFLSGGLKDKTEVWNMASEYFFTLLRIEEALLTDAFQLALDTSHNLCPSFWKIARKILKDSQRYYRSPFNRT